MPIDEHLAPLLRVALLQGLKPLQLTEIARRAERVTFEPGDVIIEKDATGDGAFLIVSGEAACTTPTGLFAAGDVVPVGALLAEMAMLIETEHSATIVASTPVRALKIVRAEIHAQMSEDPTLADHFVAVISSRLANFASGAALREEKPAREAASPVPTPPATEPRQQSVVH
jgi:CRP-like cAMP-binding protein